MLMHRLSTQLCALVWTPRKDSLIRPPLAAIDRRIHSVRTSREAERPVGIALWYILTVWTSAQSSGIAGTAGTLSRSVPTGSHN